VGLELDRDAAPRRGGVRAGRACSSNRTATTVVRLLPPLTITRAELDRALGLLEAALVETVAGPRDQTTGAGIVRARHKTRRDPVLRTARPEEAPQIHGLIMAT